MDFIRLVTWLGVKGLSRKRMWRLKNYLWIFVYDYFWNKDHQPGVVLRSIKVFLYSLSIFFFFSFFSLFLPLFFSRFVIFCQSFRSLIDFFYLILRSFWYTLWVNFQGIDNPCLGWFWKNIVFGSKRVQGIYIYIYIFWIKKYGHISSQFMIVLFSNINLEKKFNDHQHMSNFFYFHFFYIFSSTLLLRPPS